MRARKQQNHSNAPEFSSPSTIHWGHQILEKQFHETQAGKESSDASPVILFSNYPHTISSPIPDRRNSNCWLHRRMSLLINIPFLSKEYIRNFLSFPYKEIGKRNFLKKLFCGLVLVLLHMDHVLRERESVSAREGNDLKSHPLSLHCTNCELSVLFFFKKAKATRLLN